MTLPFHMLRQLAGIPIVTPMKLMDDNTSYTGVNMGHLWNETALLIGEMRALLKLYDLGQIKPIVEKRLPFRRLVMPISTSMTAKTKAKLCLFQMDWFLSKQNWE